MKYDAMLNVYASNVHITTNKRSVMWVVPVCVVCNKTMAEILLLGIVGCR